jgi:hypothetical protein
MNPTICRFLPSIIALTLLVFPRSAVSQVAPAGLTVIQSPPGVFYTMYCDSVQPNRAVFYYLNYTTLEFDAINPTVSASGFFSGISLSTGRMLTGQIQATTISLSYNSVARNGPKESLYGPTRQFAGQWPGTITDPGFGTGFVQLFTSSHGECFALMQQNFTSNVGMGTIDSGGRIVVPFLSGVTLSGTFAPANGVARGMFALTTGATDTYALTKAVTPRLANLSTRGVVSSGEQVLIGGFIITDGGKTVLITGKGPSLSTSGVANPVRNPRLDLYRNGQVIASNTDWESNSNSTEIAASGVGPTDPREAALQVNLEPGIYTAIVSSEDATSGIGLVEVYGVGSPLGY